MAYDANGMWKPEDDRVDTELARVTSQDNPLLKRARYTGLAQGQARGLLNSTMATGAGEAAVLDKALPIAQQNAQQIFGKNTQAQNYQESRGLNQQKFGFDTELQGQQIQGQKDLAGMDITSREKINERQITSNEGLAARELSSVERRTADTLASSERVSQNTLASNERVGGLDRASREAVAALDRVSQERIQGMQLQAEDRRQVGTMVSAIDANYQNALAAIAQNPDIPADVRERYINNAAAVRDSTLGLLEQVYAVNLDWASPTAAGATPGGQTVPLPGGGTATVPPPPPAITPVASRTGNGDPRAPQGWDGAAYLRQNPDVAEGLMQPAWANLTALDHYLQYGRNEGRTFTTSPPPPPPPPTINSSAINWSSPLNNGGIDPYVGLSGGRTQFDTLRRGTGFPGKFAYEGGQPNEFENWLKAQPAATRINYVNSLISANADPDYLRVLIADLGLQAQ